MNIDEMPAGREMDALIAKQVMGWHRKGEELEAWVKPAGTLTGIAFCKMVEDWSPSTDIKSAWQVWQKVLAMEETWRWTWTFCDEITCITWHGDWLADRKDSEGIAPLAICRAALKAVSILE